MFARNHLPLSACAQHTVLTCVNASLGMPASQASAASGDVKNNVNTPPTLQLLLLLLLLLLVVLVVVLAWDKSCADDDDERDACSAFVG